ncbi:helix-turn-helix transcriptional regulator [Paraliobacillus salinarum]|uniref:helix-turn-helix transcriptional regulator n=1 Tax=Paraliobacillus salinarum TaxID=1158996 RepID=UPI0015F4525B|nr:hypothetical protein [Paraliobacillus salinarum]
MKRYTPEEVNYLEQSVGKVKLDTMAKNLNRTTTAILMKLKRMGIYNTTLESGKITISELSRALNVDRSTVKRWTFKKGLKVTKQITRLKKTVFLISVSDFWEWAEGNKELVNFFKVERQALLPEPKWLEEARAHDFYNKSHKQFHKWTAKEDQRLLTMIKQGYTYKDIADCLNRGERAVERRFSRIRSRMFVKAS